MDLAIPPTLAVGPLNEQAQIVAAHHRRQAVRVLAGLPWTTSTDVAELCDLLGLDPAEGRADLPPLELTAVLPPPLDRPPPRSSMPPALRDLVVTEQPRPRPVKTYRSLEDELADLELGDPAVAATAASYDETAAGILARPHDPELPTEGATDDRPTVQGQVSGEAAATTAHRGASSRTAGRAGREVTPAAKEGGRAEQPRPAAPCTRPRPPRPSPAEVAQAYDQAADAVEAQQLPTPTPGYRDPGRVRLVPDEQKPRCGKNDCPKHRGHVGRCRRPDRPRPTGECGCGKPIRHLGRCVTGDTEQVVTKVSPAVRDAMLAWAAELGQTPSAYLRSLILADLRCQGRLDDDDADPDLDGQRPPPTEPTVDPAGQGPDPTVEAGPADQVVLPAGPAPTRRRAPRRPTVDVDPAEAARRYAAGEGLFDLARSLGIGAARLRSILAGQGVELRKRGQVVGQRGTAPRPLDEEECVRLYVDEHLEVAQVARRLGVKNDRVTAVLRNRGVLRRPLRQAVPLDAERCRQLYATGMSTAAVARELGVRVNRVQEQLRADGLLRPRGRPRAASA